MAVKLYLGLASLLCIAWSLGSKSLGFVRGYGMLILWSWTHGEFYIDIGIFFSK